ncbi:hypothetical protein [Psychrobacter sp. DAB_AL43B]|uniref:hypothetical protein n=1 Tax=Psychrobacter sp. DAB_AL43B TaxID=1028416 RepID=UPI0009A5B5CD|nr:hypothetical protein [Psychrobacter sp. DAB_AL43B]SLJ83759.1 hypothetical protein DABAL43B_0550 [Psychrobacter sp. DAB_AL43B]
MKVFKLTAVALASTLLLAGCGSDSDNNGSSSNGPNIPGVPSKPTVDNSVAEIDQAKSIIQTAKQFVLDNQAISDAYEGASDILTNKQQQRIDITFEIPESLSTYMKTKNKQKLTSADIIALGTDADFNNAIGNITLAPSSDFTAIQNANGEFTLSGTTTVLSEKEDYIYNPETGYGEWVVVEDTFSTTFNGFKNSLSSNASSTTFSGGFGFNSINIGSGSEQVVFSSTSKGATISGEFSDKVIVNDEFDLNDVNRAGITLKRAVMELGDLKIQANDSIINATKFKIAFLDMSHKLANGKLVVRTLPSTINLTGQLIKVKPATNATITLNAVANENDIKNIIKVTADGNVEEIANKFVGMDVVLSLKGTVAGKNTTSTSPVPLDIQVNLKRTARNVIELQALTATVNKKNLYVTGKTTLDSDYNVIRTELTFTQNNAVIVLNLDANNDIIKQDTSTGKLADIKVNGRIYGELLENNGNTNAKFIDKSFIPLG